LFAIAFASQKVFEHLQDANEKHSAWSAAIQPGEAVFVGDFGTSNSAYVTFARCEVAIDDEMEGHDKRVFRVKVSWLRTTM
jgi:hypothetical protein